MDERQQQLVAAAEALRTWVHTQKAMWAQGYPQSLVRAQSQLSSTSVAALAMPAAISDVMPATAPSWPAVGWPDTDLQPVAGSSAVSETVGATVHKATEWLRAWWKMLAAVGAVAMVAMGVSLAWPALHKTVSSNAPAGTNAANVKTDTRARGAAAAAAPVGGAAGTKGNGRLQVDSSPTGARVLVDGKERGITPLTLEALPVGSHKVIIRGDQGSVQRTIAIAAGELAQLNESIYSGWLHVTAPFEVRISEGRKAITLDDSNQVLLPPGPHDIRFENRGLGLREIRHVEIRPGETSVLSLETPVSHLTITSSEPATVSIDGEQVGETPLTDHVVPIGTRDVTVVSASGVTRHQTLTVTTQPAQLEIDFSKP